MKYCNETDIIFIFDAKYRFPCSTTLRIQSIFGSRDWWVEINFRKYVFGRLYLTFRCNKQWDEGNYRCVAFRTKLFPATG